MGNDAAATTTTSSSETTIDCCIVKKLWTERKGIYDNIDGDFVRSSVGVVVTVQYIKAKDDPRGVSRLTRLQVTDCVF